MEQIGFIDWDVAVATGRAFVPPGPELPAEQIEAVVSELRSAAALAPDHVREVSGLDVPALARTFVVDRATWIKACAASMSVMIDAAGIATGQFDAIAGRVRGGEVGAVLAAVSTRILGQFDPFATPARLLLVAPNVVAIERELGVHPSDFRLWVCLHEMTHQFQFGQAPWLRDHMLGLVAALLNDAEGFTWRAGGGSLLDHVLGPAQREAFDQVTAVMSLIEGYADVMMDRVGTAVIPTLPVIRRAFEQRRDRGGWTAVVGRLLGNDLKLAQYREGAAFCRTVIERAGLAALNTAWTQPEALPGLAEVRDPGLWLRRVPG